MIGWQTSGIYAEKFGIFWTIAGGDALSRFSPVSLNVGLWTDNKKKRVSYELYNKTANDVDKI